MSRYANAARIARDEARARRHALIVTRTAYDATRVMRALQDALRPRDGEHPKLMHSNGLWGASSDAWGSGRITVRVQGVGLRGITADAVLIERTCQRSTVADALLIVATSHARLIGEW
ncbi:hypothetical protein BFN01_02190 [Microbacterium sp. AR7-10]|nr:hypothetical protein BFN01_02190 [Microbacterium sp. AR7-10]